jgi:hypothetical protein
VLRSGSSCSGSALTPGSVAGAGVTFQGCTTGPNGRSGTCPCSTRTPCNISILEGINNKIKVLKRIAYGYRDEAYFFLKIRAAFPGNP